MASAHAAHVARRAGEFGVVIGGGVSVDMAKVKARKDAIVRRSSEGVEKWLRALDNVTVHTGHARFESPRSIRVEDRILQADRIFINVGARAHVPSFPGLDRVPYRTNSGMMAVDSLPEHLVIIGGGYIGIEFAQMYRRFGSRVTLIHRGDRLLPRESADVSSAVREILESEGVEVRLNADCMGVDTLGDRVVANVACDDGPPGVTGSMLLVAAGRRPNTDDLGLEAAGVEVDARGHVRVDDALATSVSGVWALGECNGRGAFTHTAYNDYEIVAANLLHGDRRRVSDRIDCYGLFIDPPLGRVGMTERQVRASGRPALVAKRPMTKVGRAVQRGETQGFMKVLVDASNKQILGAAILGVGGDEAVHAILDVMYAKAPYTVIQRAVHVHPTVAELVPTMLGDLQPLV